MRFTLDSSHDNQVSVVLEDVEEQAASDTSSSRSSDRRRRRSSSGSSYRDGPKKPQMSSLRVASVIVILGVAAAGAFWSMGVLATLNDSQRALIQDSDRLAHRLLAAFREYETAALWVQQSCLAHIQQQQQQQQQQDTNTNSSLHYYPSDFRSFFRDVYEGVVAQGLRVSSIQYVPNVTQSQRAWYEQEALAFYQQHYPSVAAAYQGFVRAEATDNGTMTAGPMPQQPFYLPVHFVEPVMENTPLIDMDLYATESSRKFLQSDLPTKQPHITQRLRWRQQPSTETEAYSVLLIHPGLNTTRPYDDDHHESTNNNDIAVVVIRIHDLFSYMTVQDPLYETTDVHGPDMKVYLYDSTPNSDTLQEPTGQFLGAAELKHFEDGDQHPHQEYSMEYLPEIAMEKLMSNITLQRNSQTLQTQILNLGQRQWTMVSVVEDRTYTTSPVMAILAGTMILIAFLCLAMWIHAMMNRAALASKLKSKSQEDQALLRIDHARQAAAAERQLNEFIAHEVRNPLAAAMSACSFVTSVLQQEAEKSALRPVPVSTSSSSSSNPPRQPNWNKQPSPLFSISASHASQQQQQPNQQPTPSPLFAIATTSSSKNTPIASKAPLTSPFPLFQLTNNTNCHPGETTESTSNTESESSTCSESLHGTNMIPSPLFSLALQARILPTQREASDDEPSMGNNNIKSPAPLSSLVAASKAEPPSQSQAQTECIKKDVHSVPNVPLFSIPPTARSVSLTRTPSHAQIIGDEDTRESVMADLHIIDSSLQFINDLLRNMLDVQRAACHQLTIEKGPTDILRDILEPVDAMLYLRGRNVEVQLDCGPDTNLLVETDRLRLKQVVLNLGRNAAKFVEKGHVRFRVVVVPGKPPHPHPMPAKDGTNSSSFVIEEAQPSTETVQIWIEDTGPGIPADKRAKLFAKFQESLDTLAQGTGLGLSLCRILVRLMGGKIWLDETYHSGFDDRPGSRFIIDLCTPPLRVEEGDDIGSSRNSNGEVGAGTYTETLAGSNIITAGTHDEQMDGSLMNSSGRLRAGLKPSPQDLPVTISCLLVDDDTVLRKLLVRAVRGVAPGWSIQEAASGEAALRLVDEGRSFDLIFMDQYMASMQKQLLGTETTHALRSRGVQARICGLSANEIAEEFFAAGANNFVCKPLPTKKESLHQILCEILLDEPRNRKSTGILKHNSLVGVPP